jgi:hypothetical protein
MKLPVLVATLIVSVVCAAPAAAATKKHKKAVAVPGSSATTTSHAKPASDPYAVYVSGEYIGRDPDPNIRAYMARNPHIWDGPQ